MKKFKFNIVVFIAVLLLIFSGCSIKDSSKNTVKDDILFLTSKTCSGRLTGTEGNQIAGNYIADQFLDANLDFAVGNSFYIPYMQETLDMQQTSQTISVTYSDNRTETFKAGRDYYPTRLEAPSLSGQVTLSEDKTAVFLIDGNTSVAQIRSSASAVIPYPWEMQDFIPNICVPDDIYQKLAAGTFVSIEGQAVFTPQEVNNIVGILRGENSDRAIFITAHYDHVGSYGDTVFPGALDNASGVAVMLETLRIFLQENVTPPVDIVFCAFNGEEMDLQGSRSFLEQNFMNLNYEQVNVINLDTIGFAQETRLVVSGSQSALTSQVMNALQNYGFLCEIETAGKSDHYTFESHGIPAVLIATYGTVPNTIIHTPADQSDLLDLNQLEQLGAFLFDYCCTQKIVTAQENATVDFSMIEAENFALEQAKLRNLRHDQVLIFTMSGFLYSARVCSPITDLDQVHTLWPDNTLRKKIGTFKFEQLDFPVADEINIYRTEETSKDTYVTVKAAAEPNDQFYSYRLTYGNSNNEQFIFTKFDLCHFTIEDITAFLTVKKHPSEETPIYILSTEGGQFVALLYYDSDSSCAFSLESSQLSQTELTELMVDHIDTFKAIPLFK